METIEIISTLKVFNKWLRGKGKKYVNGEVDCNKVSDAVKSAIVHLGRRVDKAEFITLVNMAEEDAGYRKRDKEVLTALHKSALKAGRKVVKFLNAPKDGK